MDKDIFDFSFDEITSMSDIEDCREGIMYVFDIIAELL